MNHHSAAISAIARRTLASAVASVSVVDAGARAVQLVRQGAPGWLLALAPRTRARALVTGGVPMRRVEPPHVHLIVTAATGRAERMTVDAIAALPAGAASPWGPDARRAGQRQGPIQGSGVDRVLTRQPARGPNRRQGAGRVRVGAGS